MNDSQFWTSYHQKYAEVEWITKPTLFAEQIITRLPQKGTLLDLGAGQGQNSRFFARHGYTVTSTDFVDVALETSKRLAEQEHLEMQFKNVNLSRPLPFEDKQFDIVYAHLSLHYFDDPMTQRLFTEIHRVLKPGGTFASLFNTVDDPELLTAKKVEGNLYQNEGGIIKRYYSVSDIEDFTQKLFWPVLLDNHGVTHKDEIKTLIRFVGQRIE